MSIQALRAFVCASVGLLLGAAGSTNPPPPSAWTVRNAVASDRSYGRAFTESSAVGATYTPLLAHFVTRGILRVTSAPGRMHGDVVPTAYGRRAIAQRGWVLEGGGDLMIGSGRIQLVPGSIRVVQAGRIARVTYRWRFEPSRDLLDVAPLRTWPSELAPSCVDAPGVARRSFARTIQLTYGNDGVWRGDARSWTPGETCGRGAAHAAKARGSVVPRAAVETGIDAAVDTYLAQRTSNAWLLLDAQRQDRMSELLERDGIIRARFSYPTCFGPKTSFAMTDHGERVAVRRNWLDVGWGLYFSTGWYEEVRGARRVTPLHGGGYAAHIVYRFVPNANAVLVPWLVPTRTLQTATLDVGTLSVRLSRFDVATC
ncbi:MAG: hypothetical protein KGN02_00380 [bacterium]|nr:hypothetical protein [bacterium]